jgi:hypothetical protein
MEEENKEDDSKILAEALNLTLSERVGHTNWKIRSAMYEEVKASCDRMSSDDDPLLNDYGAPRDVF